ncbi:hypothetical protein DFH06DRAFT_1145608 [Mycena polygramma]|nr:hypothetical protein DFH06DRAFT_1145608 [Mycena polygramma]
MYAVRNFKSSQPTDLRLKTNCTSVANSTEVTRSSERAGHPDHLLLACGCVGTEEDMNALNACEEASERSSNTTRWSIAVWKQGRLRCWSAVPTEARPRNRTSNVFKLGIGAAAIRQAGTSAKLMPSTTNVSRLKDAPSRVEKRHHCSGVSTGCRIAAEHISADMCEANVVDMLMGAIVKVVNGGKAGRRRVSNTKSEMQGSTTSVRVGSGYTTSKHDVHDLGVVALHGQLSTIREEQIKLRGSSDHEKLDIVLPSELGEVNQPRVRGYSQSQV